MEVAMADDRLEVLLQNHGKREKNAGGEIFAFWGTLNLLGLALSRAMSEKFFLIWLVLVPSGIVIQSLYIRYLYRHRGFKLFWEHRMTELWSIMLVLLPLFFYVFPVVMKLYQPKAIMSMVTLWLGLALLMSGIIVRQVSLKFGAFAMFTASLLLAYFPEQMYLLYTSAVIAGLIIPGVWSKYEERTSS
jgi:hypothetical protein